ncbi:MAG: DUF2855 family protein [Burkholderiaceae bacterium]|nr:DUF2855 family protein [Burkholderiaceae bacterium]
MSETHFQVRRQALAETRCVQREAAPLADGQVRVRVDRCAYTANNITYAAFGEAMHYWDFYPTGDADWGNIPVWGFGDVVQSLHPGVAVGERLYGYWPSASHAVLAPTRLRAAGFADGSAHRASLPAVYNQLLRCNQDPLYTRDSEDLQALLRPLFTTSWLIDDFLADEAFFGAARVLLSSASSKTANATAALLHARGGVEVVGLTSPANSAYCERLGAYHRVLAYDDLETLAPDAPAVYVDFAGNGALRRRVHAHLPALAYSCSVGGTHVDQLAGARDLPGPRPVLFFAPVQVKKRLDEWGPEAFEQRLAEAWRAHLARVTAGPAPWVRVVAHAAPEGLAALHARVLGGRDDPEVGCVMVWGR